jgi:hypothetical protein
MKRAIAVLGLFLGYTNTAAGDISSEIASGLIQSGIVREIQYANELARAANEQPTIHYRMGYEAGYEDGLEEGKRIALEAVIPDVPPDGFKKQKGK